MDIQRNDIFGASGFTERNSRNEVSIGIFTRLLRDRIIWISSPITEETANVVMAQMLYLESEDEDEEIYLYINSLGGDIVNGLAIYDTMQLIRPDIVTICAGNSRGIATVLLAAGTPGKRMALPNAVIHNVPTYKHLDDNMPDAEIETKFATDIQERVCNILAKHTGQPLERIKRDIERDNYLSANEAIEYGLLDTVVTRQSKPF